MLGSDAFPARTVDLLKNVDAAMFGAITSKPVKAAAAEFARKFKRKKITVIHKANVVRATDGLFLECAKAVAMKFPDQHGKGHRGQAVMSKATRNNVLRCFQPAEPSSSQPVGRFFAGGVTVMKWRPSTVPARGGGALLA